MGFFGRKQEHLEWRPLHQRERPEYHPEESIMLGGLRALAWADKQLRAFGFDPALVRRPAPVQQPRNTGGHTPIPPTRDTPGEIPAQELARRAAWSDVDTVQDLRRKREWLYGQVPTSVSQPMPVLRNATAERTGPLSAASLPPEIVAQLPDRRPLTVNDAPLDEMLATMRQNSRPLPPFLGFSDPNIVPDLPTEPRKPGDFDENGWINGVTLPAMQEDPDAPAAGDKINEMSENSGLGLTMPTQEAWDRRMAEIREAERARLLAIPDDALVPDLTDEDATMAQKDPALHRLQLMVRKQKESE